jgi:hypothetical protein
MSSKKEPPKDEEEPTVRATERRDLTEVMRDNAWRILDEMAKAQPQFSQSITHVHLAYIQSWKNMIQIAFSTQKQIASAMNVTIPASISDLFARQSNEITNNIVSSESIFYQYAINTFEAMCENINIYNRTAEEVSHFNNNMWKVWGTLSYHSSSYNP